MYPDAPEKRMPVPGSCTSHSTRMTPRNSQGAGLQWANTLFGELLWKTFNEKPYLLEY